MTQTLATFGTMKLALFGLVALSLFIIALAVTRTVKQRHAGDTERPIWRQMWDNTALRVPRPTHAVTSA